MKSSGIKRGLAATAISALAITGVPFLAGSASANPVNDQVSAVTLLSQANGQASVKDDGTDTTIRLEAGAPANIAAVTFRYSAAGGAAQEIATVSSRNDDGAFSHEWTVPNGLLGATVTLSVSGTPTGGAAQTDDQIVVINGAGAAADTANLATGSAVGVFQAPYNGNPQNVVVSGTTSATGGSVSVVDVDGTGGAASTAVGAPVTAGTGATTGTFKGVLDIASGAAYAYNPPNELVVRAERDTDDVESYTLYTQTITAVSAVATDASVPAGSSTTVTVTVLDQNSKPIAGARVRSDQLLSPAVYTDADGKATFSQTAGATRFYYADATSSLGYEAGLGDKRSADVTVGDFVPVATTLAATSADGAAFDRDEYAAGDIAIQVKNQNGGNFNPANEQDVNYYWQITPFDGSAATRVPATLTTASVDTGDGANDGKYEIAFPGGVNGTYALFASLEANTLGNGAVAEAKVLEVKAGQATIAYTPAGDASAEAGAQVTVNGKLALEDGTGLAARTVAATYTRGTGSDPAADAGLVPASGSTLVTSRDYTTAADGTFTAVVDDPAETPQGTEIDGSLSTDTGFTAAAAKSVDFSSTTPPTGTTIAITEITGAPRPGTAVAGTATVTQPDGADAGTDRDPVVGQLITLTVDKGFFTDGNVAATPVVGADAGVLKSLTKTITATTDASGLVTFQTSIARDEGFDDDGLVEAIVTAAAGTVTDTEDVDYSSANPLNGGTVRLELSPEGEQDGATDPAPVGNDVAFDVYVTDQFGNLVGGEPVSLTEDGDDATVSAATATSDFEDDGDFTVTSTEDDTVTVTGSWLTETLKYSSTTGNGSPVAASETVTGTAQVEFAEFDLDAADLYLITRPAGTVPVGGAATETLTVVDEFGNLGPAGLQVTFTRVGPGATTDSVVRTTNANGQAAYAFVGTGKGIATVTAEVTDGSKVNTVSDTVSFANPTPPVRAITSTVKGTDNGAAKDTIKVSTKPAAAGATVRLFKVVNGKKVAAGVKTLKANGMASFIKVDGNGNGVTKYFVKVDPTATTKGDRSNTLRLR
jgi:hypothetical protein